MTGHKLRKDWQDYLFLIKNNLSNIKIYKFNDIDRNRLIHTKLTDNKWVKLSDYYFVYVKSDITRTQKLTHIDRLHVKEFKNQTSLDKNTIMLIEKQSRTIRYISDYLNFIAYGPIPTFTVEDFIDSLHDINAYLVPINNLAAYEISTSLLGDNKGNDLLKFLQDLGPKSETILQGNLLCKLKIVIKITTDRDYVTNNMLVNDNYLFELYTNKLKQSVIKVRIFDEKNRNRIVRRFIVYNLDLRKITDINIKNNTLVNIDTNTIFDSNTIGEQIKDAIKYDKGEIFAT